MLARLLRELAEPEEAGGEAACFAHLVCPECGAVTTEGHRAGLRTGWEGPMGENLAGRLAVVTGGASGIGEACATRLAADGAAVVVADLNADAAAAVADRIGGRAVEVDLAADFDAAALAGQADILVNCAGLQHVAAGARVPAGEVPADPRGDARSPVPAGPGGAAAHVRAGLRPDREHLLGARPAGLARTSPPTSRPSTAWRGSPR